MSIRLNAETIRWAAERSGFTVEQLNMKFPKLQDWIEGTRDPSVKQLSKLATTLHIRYFELFSEQRPDYGLQIADFRTVDDGGHAKDPSPELYDTVSMMTERQEWLRNFFAHENISRVPLVGSFRNRPMNHKTALTLAAEFHRVLGLDEIWAARCKTVIEARKLLKDAIEACGISVVINGIVGDNTRRALDVDEFRGFVLADSIAPIIFVNGRDARSAQLFTLVHELTHLAFAQTGVSNPSYEDEADMDVERFCNAVAAEFLVPGESLMVEQDLLSHDAYRWVKQIAASRKVNFIVVARRAHDIGLLSDESFFELCRHYRGEDKGVSDAPSFGGNYFKSKQYRLGSVFGDAVFEAVNNSYLSYLDAYYLTGLNAPNFKNYFEEVS